MENFLSVCEVFFMLRYLYFILFYFLLKKFFFWYRGASLVCKDFPCLFVCFLGSFRVSLVLEEFNWSAWVFFAWGVSLVIEEFH